MKKKGLGPILYCDTVFFFSLFDLVGHTAQAHFTPLEAGNQKLS